MTISLEVWKLWKEVRLQRILELEAAGANAGGTIPDYLLGDQGEEDSGRPKIVAGNDVIEFVDNVISKCNYAWSFGYPY